MGHDALNSVIFYSCFELVSLTLSHLNLVCSRSPVVPPHERMDG